MVTSATLLACSMAAPPARTTRTATGTGSVGATPHAAGAAVKQHKPVPVHQLAVIRSDEVRLR